VLGREVAEGEQLVPVVGDFRGSLGPLRAVCFRERTPATLLGVWAGKKIVARITDRVFVLLVELRLVAAGVLFLVGL
jgi:hypothetical protein